MNSTYALSSWLFTRALSVVYLIAFLSLTVQARALWGSRGVLPIGGYLQAVEAQIGPQGYWRLPSLFWFSSSDTMISGLALLGAAAALVALLGFAQGWMLAICFLVYLAYVSAGQEFMSFQWDALLLEVGFLSLFAVSWRWRFELGLAEEPHWFVRTMFYVVLFKLMFLSGVVKLESGDQSWRDFSALTYHYWTQPLLNPLAAFVHFSPRWLHQVSTAMTFVVELLLPFLIFFPRTRWLAAAGFTGLSVLILLTGNYTFFNWLTLALCIWLIPDSFWRGMFDLTPWSLHTVEASVSAHPAVSYGMAALLVLSLIWCTRWFLPDLVMTVLSPVLQAAQSFHVSNSYGLFATMTKTRPEIIIEGSLDGQEWREYEFKYKPGNLYRRPPQVAPHQPRLDWQMWFAALGSYRQSPWVQNLILRLFENSPEVTALLAWNPFPDQGPKFIRAKLYEYEFTSTSEIFNDGLWWKRKLVGEFTPTYQR